MSENLDKTLSIVGRIIRKPLFSSLRINRVKEQMLHQREREEDDSQNIGHQAFLDKLFCCTH